MKIEIETRHLFSVLDEMLISLLGSLSEEEWHAPTVARLWNVKDVASHLLDGNLRALSVSRDGYRPKPPESVAAFHDIVAYLNKRNLAWTTATEGLSPGLLIMLLDLTGKQYTAHLQTLDAHREALYPVAWAGQEVSPNWFHIAREYTEKFLHQQQIRAAVNKPGLMTKALFGPFMEVLMYAFPYAFQEVDAEVGTVVSMEVSTEIGGQWSIVRGANRWELKKGLMPNAQAGVVIDPNTAWKLFSKSWSPAQAAEYVEIRGNPALAEQALKMTAVMA